MILHFSPLVWEKGLEDERCRVQNTLQTTFINFVNILYGTYSLSPLKIYALLSAHTIFVGTISLIRIM